ncbi:MAG: tRNA (guanosine(46)-N7)-methyltransferase TrmB, partial [Clostridiales bacterium]|nr:tRNA (guanosine(46)-N7)-methyltransferase TrmB [Clostridiales bacterium]
MRLRNVRGSKELVGKNPFVVKDAQLYKNKWQEFFKN